MKQEKKIKVPRKKRRKGVKINPSLQGKYDNQPMFHDKVNRANHIIKTVGIPKFDQ